MKEDSALENGQQGEPQSDTGDRYELSGDFRGAVINIKSTIVGAAEIKELEDLPPEPGEPPFQGLQYYDENDADRFFGREQLTARIIARLQRTRFLAVIGASGSGKSSLVRAGVIPAMRRGERLADGGLPPKDSGQWAYRVFTPTAHPLESLAAVLSSDNGSISAISDLQENLNKNPNTLGLAARQLLNRQSKKHLMLVVDQFEEVFTQCRNAEERERFFEHLLQAADPQGSNIITLMIVLRADFYTQIAENDRLRETVSQHQEFIGAMTRQELVSAIDRPLAQGNWKIQEGLVEVILDDVGYEPGALPLLSHALLETWKRRRGRTLTLSGYTESGGIAGAVAQTAETVFRQNLTPEQQPIARLIFMRMTELGEDAHDTRRRATFSELITRSTDELLIETVINILVDARLVTTGTVKPSDTKVVELAHEALIREWDTLREWLNEDRQGLILHRQLADAAKDWIKMERDPGLLYRGVRLEQAVEWAQAHPNMLSIQETEFLEKSQHVAREEAERARKLARAARIQRMLALALVLLVIFAGGLVYNFVFRQEPARMDGFFNVAVAEFHQINPDGSLSPVDAQISSVPEAFSKRLSEIVYESLDEQLADNPNLLVWHDGPELQDQNVVIGPVYEPGSVQKPTPQETAQRLNAHMIVYGAVDLRSATPSLKVKFWLAERQDVDYSDLLGGFEPGEAIPLENLEFGNGVPELQRQANAMAWIVLGLSEAQLGHSLEALEAMLSAREFLPNSDMVEFFIGREYLFLVGREAALQFAQEEFEAQAEAAFQRAVQINPNNARALTGLGSVYFKRAQRLLTAVDSNGESSPALAQALDLTEEAIAAYEQAAGLPGAAGSIPTDQVAVLGLGNSYSLMGRILQRMGQTEEALAQFDLAIETLQLTPGAFEPAEFARYRAQAYEYLGTAYRWRGYTLEVQGEFEASLEAYRQAAAYFESCVQQGEETTDIIVKNEIVQESCLPDLNKVQQILENYTGGQG